MGISSVGGATTAAMPTAPATQEKVYFRYQFKAKGGKGPLAIAATISITETRDETASRHTAWRKFAELQKISEGEARLHYTMMKLTGH